MKAGKVWGETELIIARDCFELHKAVVKAGGICSKHKHQHKWNLFALATGEMEVEVYKNDYKLVDVTHLQPGDSCIVPPGEFHQFRALQDSILYEFYFVQLDLADIVRENHGRMEKSK